MCRYLMFLLVGLSIIYSTESRNRCGSATRSTLDINATIKILNQLTSGRNSSGDTNLLDLNLLISILHQLSDNGGRPLAEEGLFDALRRSCVGPAASSRSNSLIAINVLIRVLIIISGATSSSSGGVIAVTAFINLLSAIAGNGTRPEVNTPGGQSLISIPVVLQVLNDNRRTNDIRTRYCDLSELGRQLTSASTNTSGSVISRPAVSSIFTQVILSSGRRGNTIRVDLVIQALTELLTSITSGSNDSLVSVRVCLSLLNNISRTGGGLLGLVGNLLGDFSGGLRTLLSGALGGRCG